MYLLRGSATRKYFQNWNDVNPSYSSQKRTVDRRCHVTDAAYPADQQVRTLVSICTGNSGHLGARPPAENHISHSVAILGEFRFPCQRGESGHQQTQGKAVGEQTGVGGIAHHPERAGGDQRRRVLGVDAGAPGPAHLVLPGDGQHHAADRPGHPTAIGNTNPGMATPPNTNAGLPSSSPQPSRKSTLAVFSAALAPRLATHPETPVRQ
jgi:hypothetical protein